MIQLSKVVCVTSTKNIFGDDSSNVRIAVCECDTLSLDKRILAFAGAGIVNK